MTGEPDTSTPPRPPATRHYFVDEAGDATIFDRNGRVIVGEEGCSTHFVLGMLDIADAPALDRDLFLLRTRLLADPLLRGVPSMQLGAKKTAVAFHAKDDVPEIRWEVFKALARHDVRFYAVVRDKRGLAKDVQNRNTQSATYRYHPNALYDEMVKRLFKDRLHKDDSYRVCFATRGSADRTKALNAALIQARNNFRRQWGIDSDAPIEVSCAASRDSGGLQAADYFLWALQRLYVKGEDRFLSALTDKIGVIHDVDDRRKSKAGAYYTRERPPSAESTKKTPGI